MIFSPASRRRLKWRLGRYIYLQARGVVANNIDTNGEAYVQACVLRGAGNSGVPLTVFDVGANLGAWTSSLIKQAPADLVERSKIWMFEPVPETFKKLKNNVNQMENGHIAEAYPLAMSDEAGESEMVVLSETGGTNSLEFDDKMAAGAIKKVKIKKTTLDTFCREHGVGHIHLLKCDTEGHDAHAVLGAREMLREGRLDVVQFEYNHRWIYARSYLKDMFDLIDGLPYRLGRICPDHIEIFKEWHFELEHFFEGNYVIIREPALVWFDAREGTFDVSNTYA